MVVAGMLMAIHRFAMLLRGVSGVVLCCMVMVIFHGKLIVTANRIN